MDLIVKEWEQACLPIQEQIDSFATFASGKAVRSSSRPPNDRRPSHTLNRFRSNHNLSGHQSSATSPADMRPIPAYNSKPSLGSRSKSASSAPVTPSVPLLTKPPIQSFPSSSQVDVRTPSSSHLTTDSSEQYLNGLSPQKLLSIQTSPVLVGKKKPPPPPPKPRSASSHASFVTALYDFGGQSVGDLAFQTGDRIRVLKKTDSTDDWWEGELHGTRGSFPANYVE
ncbi:hypothetical protein ASPCAL00112 [Aspergillus calidoustus]|uniref:SH3 domain-containing protein n=1 Tax=Aspergillus calidoustus TaxID=454130 RepID=A0A0U5FM80_ASPCI|nr:hypothetical protein ASPCAL00112 [Aspergillus calidoustus]